MALVIVSVLLHSGLPNPQWELGGNDALRLIRLLADLPRCECPMGHLGGLGYSGIVLDLVAEGAAVQSWTIYEGIAMQGEWCFRDKDRQLERHLLLQGKQLMGNEIPEDLLG